LATELVGVSGKAREGLAFFGKRTRTAIPGERERKQDLREMPSKRSVEQVTVKKRGREQASAISGAQEEEKSAEANIKRSV